MTVTNTSAQRLIRFAHALSVGSIPPSVIDRAKWCLLDAVGCSFFGSQQAWSKIVIEEMLQENSTGQSGILGSTRTLAPPAAALCNGTAIHGFELDDVLDEAILHPGAVVIPAALAAAESINASGPRLLLGIIAGYETMNRVGLAIGVGPVRRGYHMTAVAGPIAAAVAAGVVMGLGLSELSAAVGLACSSASGTKSFAAGTGGGMVKRLHAGRATEAGVRMAQLAQRGFTAPPTALDGKFGLLEVLSGDTGRAEQLVLNLGEYWAVENVYVKVYPVCSWIQASVQQLVSLRGNGPLEAQQVKKVRIGVSAYATRNNGEPAPIDTMGAQYSIPFSAAIALTSDPRNPAAYSVDAINEPSRRELARRVELFVDPQIEATYPKHYGARVILELGNGEQRESVIMDPHGMPSDPCDEQERMEKFFTLASSTKSKEAMNGILTKIRNCEQMQSIRELTFALRS